MDRIFEHHRNELIYNAIKMWEDNGELSDIEKDPVIKLLFSALAHQSHEVQQRTESFKSMVVNELRDKLIPFHLIKPFPAYAVIKTAVNANVKDLKEPLITFAVDDNCTFEFGKTKIPFVPLLSATIINADVADRRNDAANGQVELELTSPHVIENFAGLSFYIKGIEAATDIEIALDNKPLPIIRPDDYDNLPFTRRFRNHYMLADENQLQMGGYDYWQELYLKNQILMFYIDSYDTRKIANQSRNPVFTIRFKNLLFKEQINRCVININCIPVVNVLKSSAILSDDHPVHRLSDDNTAFLNLMMEDNTDNSTTDFYIRHFGVERYDEKELLYQVNDLFSRFIFDYYAFKDIDELKSGEIISDMHKVFKELLPVIANKPVSRGANVFALLKLDKRLTTPRKNVHITYLHTHCEEANDIKSGEKPATCSEFLNKENTCLLMDTAGGRKGERNEETLNHLVRYNLLTKDKLLTASDLKALCHKELKGLIRNVNVLNRGDRIDVQIQWKEEKRIEHEERNYYESLLTQKIKVRSLLSVPVYVNIIVNS